MAFDAARDRIRHIGRDRRKAGYGLRSCSPIDPFRAGAVVDTSEGILRRLSRPQIPIEKLALGGGEIGRAHV